MIKAIANRKSIRSFTDKKVEPEKVLVDTHIFYDLGATSIQYFSILSALSEKFSISNYQKTDTYCYTLKEICEYIEKHI